jgi:putative pyruvate formate lyase activating enzyme
MIESEQIKRKQMAEDNCKVCPRNCAVDRIHKYGYCKTPREAVVYGSMVHMGEEQIISGSSGSGTVFFVGCNLGCVFCQNHEVSQKCNGTVLTSLRLAKMFMDLENEGVHNINLVTLSHFVPSIAEAIKLAKEMGIKIPFIYNSSGYDALPSLEIMDGLIDIYLPDLKFADDALGLRYSDVPDYFTVAQKALIEMYRQVGNPVIKHGIMQKGVLIRHLVMPGLHKDSMRVLDWIKVNLPSGVINLMSGYKPAYRTDEYKEINRQITATEYQLVSSYFNKLGLHASSEYLI